ncbi:MAG: YecA family protein [Solirubrobacteraceae bacterium]
MPGPGRNQPCPCGSGRKVKHLCVKQRGPSDTQLERAYLAQHARWAAAEIADLPTRSLAELWRGLTELPDVDLSLVVPPPTLITPEFEQLLQTARDDDPDDADEVIDSLVDTIDTPHQRAALARAVINLGDSGKLTARQAAAVIIDLESRSQTLLRASLINASKPTHSSKPTHPAKPTPPRHHASNPSQTSAATGLGGNRAAR